MILFCDTSVLVKLYARGDGSDAEFAEGLAEQSTSG